MTKEMVSVLVEHVNSLLKATIVSIRREGVNGVELGVVTASPEGKVHHSKRWLDSRDPPEATLAEMASAIQAHIFQQLPAKVLEADDK